MHIIVDGYNLIRQSLPLRKAERIGLEAGRQTLLEMLHAYKEHRGHKITVVFDGWEGGSPLEERDKFGGIYIVYSKLGEKADEVIKRIVARGDDNFTVISSDREIANFVIRRGYAVISADEFERKLYASLVSGDEATIAGEYNDGEGFDADAKIGTKKKGTAFKLSKAKRREKQVLEKL